MRKYLSAFVVQRTFAALMCVLLPLLVFAAPTVHFGPAPAWVVPVRVNERPADLRNVSDGYYLKLYEEQEHVAAVALYTHMIREIFSDAGVQDGADISINFDPAYEQLTVHGITVWRDGKPMDRLRKNAFKIIASEKDLSRYIYNGKYAAYLILDDIRKGDKIEYAYTVTGQNPVFEGKFFSSYGFRASNPIGHIYYRLTTPAVRQLNFKYFNNAPKPNVISANGNTVYEWDVPDAKSMESTPDAPSWYDAFPHVQVSEYKDWGEVTDWAYRVNTPDTTLKGELHSRAGELKKKYGGDKERLFRAAVDMVQNEVRYMGVEIGRYSHKANSPTKVFDQRYGDCKDKAMLLVSTLRAMGISADMALVSSNDRGTVKDKLPSPSAFNHAIAVVHMPGRDVWVDGTISYQGGVGTDIHCPDYGYALVVRPGGTALTPIPAAKEGKTVYREEYESANTKDPISLKIYTDYYGSKADDVRLQFASQSKTDLEKGYLEYYAKKFSHIEAADTLTITDNKEENKLSTVERYTVTDFFEYDSSSKSCNASFYASMIRNMLPDIDKKGSYPIALTFPCDIDFIVNLNVPVNWNIKSQHDKIDRNSYTFSGDVSAAGNTLRLHYQFKTLKDHIATEDLKQYERDHKKLVDDHLYYPISYTEGSDSTWPGTNYLAVLIFLFAIGGCAYGGVYIYKMPTAQGYIHHRVPGNIGGWLLLPIIGLGFAAARAMYYIFSTGLLGNALWHAYDAEPNAAAITALLFLEFIVNIVTSCYAAFCLVLTFKKRDILPKHAAIFYIASMCAVILDTTLTHILIPGDEVDYKNVYRAVMAAAIWATYFARAQKVSEVFVVPYVKPSDRD